MKNSIPTILVPIDFTECSINALTAAIPIARKKQARIVALHVIDINSVQDDSAEFSDEEGKILSSLENKYQNLLDQIKSSTKHYYQFEIDTMVKNGSIPDSIENASLETGAFLIIIGTHGTGSKTSFLGSTAHAIIRKVSNAVLAIPRVKKHSIFTKILFPCKISNQEKSELLKTISLNNDTIIEIPQLIRKEDELTINDLNMKVHFLETNLAGVNLKSSQELQNVLLHLNQTTYPVKVRLTTILDSWNIKTEKKDPEESIVPVFSID